MTEPGLPLVAIFGPTAVGKTEVAVALAELLSRQGLRCTAISADAYQLYRGLEILSGAPGHKERARLPHLLVGSHGVAEEMSAGRYAGEAHAAVDAVIAAGEMPIVVGGAGLYLQAALTELQMRPPLTEEQESAALERYGERETAELHHLLTRADLTAAGALDPGDRYRIIRALALRDAGLEPSPGDSFWEASLRRPTLMIGLARDREELHARIDARVEKMVAQDAAGEIARAADASSTARKIIGFEEVPEGRIEEMKQRTRRYAKRQLTWMRRIPGLETINLTSTGPREAAQLIARSRTAAAE